MEVGEPLGVVEHICQRLESNLKIAGFEPKMGPLEHSELEREICSDQEGGGDEDHEEEGGEFEFSFPCENPNSSPVAAEDAFHNGKIRPIFPFFDQSLLSDSAHSEEPATSSSALHHQPLKKLFTEGSNTVSTSPSEADYCLWEGRTVEEIKSPAAVTLCPKSNSTGSSRLWRFKDLIHRSSSDGKDAFVFLNPTTATGDVERAEKKNTLKACERSAKKAPAPNGMTGVKGKKPVAPPSFYGRSRAGEKRRSYLPYRPGLVGFFTSVNGLSKNVHPF
ncbi:hypothetical protein SAY86_026867 [Trapa natans]|uniref:Uncharacterized protein n=1 Tax=Trapa natans TaxID=22666 RepID=A0AAN7KGG9_TRANT|nr:hypothetical protein SAY86_026867 [Trapa natans]